MRHNYSRANQVNGTFDVPTWGRSANGRETDNSNSFITQLVTNFSANLLNEFRFQYAREGRPRFYDGPDLPDTTIGTLDNTISYRFGRPFFLPVPEVDTRFQFTDNFTVIKGNHTVTFGGDFNRVKTSQTFVGFARGRYIFVGPYRFVQSTEPDPVRRFSATLCGLRTNFSHSIFAPRSHSNLRKECRSKGFLKPLTSSITAISAVFRAR